MWAFALVAPLVGAAHRAAPPPTDVTRERPAAAAPCSCPRRSRPGIALALANAGYATMAGFLVPAPRRPRDRPRRCRVHRLRVAVVATRLALGRLPTASGRAAPRSAAGLAEALGLADRALRHGLAGRGRRGGRHGLRLLAAVPVAGAVRVERVGDDRRGAALGSFTAFFDVGVGLGGPVAGAIAALGGYPAAFWAAAAFALGTAAISSRLTAARAAPA